MHVAGIEEDHVEVRPVIARRFRAAFAPARADGLHGMRLQHPVANIDDVNVLLDDDIAGQNAVVQPVAQPQFGGRGFRVIGHLQERAIVVGCAASNLAERARMNAPHQFHERGRFADLESRHPG